jgi:hypothetical protein
VVIDHPCAEREMEQVGDSEQRHHRRESGRPIGERGERQAHVAAIVEHHRRYERAVIHMQQPDKRPREEAGAQHDANGTQHQRSVVRDAEVLARQCRKYQCRRQDRHADPVDHRHVRLYPPRIEIAHQDDHEHWQDDAENPGKH